MRSYAPPSFFYSFPRHAVTNAPGFNLLLYSILITFIEQVQKVRFCRQSIQFFIGLYDFHLTLFAFDTILMAHTVSHAKCYSRCFNGQIKKWEPVFDKLVKRPKDRAQNCCIKSTGFGFASWTYSASKKFRTFLRSLYINSFFYVNYAIHFYMKVIFHHLFNLINWVEI